MNLYLDDDSADALLVRLLVGVGHDVEIPRQAGLSGEEDPTHLMHAIRSGRVLLTHNHDDFKLLHELVILVAGHHPGIVVCARTMIPPATSGPAVSCERSPISWPAGS